MTKRTKIKAVCDVSGCPAPAVGRVLVYVGDADPEHDYDTYPHLCGDHLAEEAERVRDEPEFYGLGEASS